MSYAAQAWVDTLHDLNTAEWATLSTMARYVRDEDMTFFGSMATVARITRQSRRNVQKCCRRLEDAGYLVLWRAERGRTRHYKLTGIEAPRFAPAPLDSPDDLDDMDDLDGTLWTTLEGDEPRSQGVRTTFAPVDKRGEPRSQGVRTTFAGGCEPRSPDTELRRFERDSARSRPVDSLTVEHDRRMLAYTDPNYEAPDVDAVRAQALTVRQVDEATRTDGLEALARIRGSRPTMPRNGARR